MISFIPILLLFGVLAGTALTEEKSRCWRYGDCNPGPNCENPWDDDLHRHKCFRCCDGLGCDGGYISWDKLNDRVLDCRDGTDEWSIARCRSVPCTYDSACCSGICDDGLCWDQRCGVWKPKPGEKRSCGWRRNVHSIFKI